MAYVGTVYSATPPSPTPDIPALAGYDRQWSGYQWLYHPHPGYVAPAPTAAPAPAPTLGNTDPFVPTPDNGVVSGGVTPPVGTTSADLSAKALITSFLGQANLSSLADWAWSKYLDGVPVEQIMLDLRATPEYKNRFPAMAQLAAEGRAITETDYMSYEQTVAQLLQQYGIPKGMYNTPADIAEMLIGDVSPSEVQSRLQLAATSAYQAPPEVRNAMISDYGGGSLSNQDLTAIWLDPDRALPVLQEQWATSQIRGASAIQGVNVGLPTAEQLAAQGVSFAEALQGFGNVASTAGLGGGFGETAAEQDRIAAQFGDTAAQRQVQRVQASRIARNSGGGSAAETSSGVVGLGAASTR
jgi:hypothetical protein